MVGGWEGATLEGRGREVRRGGGAESADRIIVFVISVKAANSLFLRMIVFLTPDVCDSFGESVCCHV